MAENVEINKARYLHYKKKCEQLEAELRKHQDLLSSLRNLLQDAPTQLSCISPVHASPPTLPSSTQQAKSPVLGGGVRASWLAYRAPLRARARLFTDTTENFEPGGNKWELETSYDRIPSKQHSPPYQHVNKVVRGAKRKALQGFTCSACEKFYANVGVHGLVQKCSRHRSRHPPVRSPKGYWDVDMPSTQEIRMKQTAQQDEDV